MNKITLGILCLAMSGAACANTITTTNSPYASTTNKQRFYVGTRFIDGSFIDQYQIDNATTLTGTKNNGLTGGDIHIGMKNQSFRVEASLDYLNTRREYQTYDSFVKENVLKSTPSNSLAAILDAYYDFKFSSNFSSYIGAGIGYLHTFASGTAESQQSGDTSSSNNAVFNAKVGFSFKVDPSLQAFAEASTMRLANETRGMSNKNHFNAFSVGINYLL